MNKHALTRRKFLRQAGALSLGSVVLSFAWPLRALAQEHTPFNYVEDLENPTALEAEHLINVRLPIIAEDGANVPMVISMDHPMEAGHYIKNFQLVNFRDPISSKGIYHLTPANGQAYLSTQIRMDGGDTEIYVIAECTQHGRWVARESLKVSLGGC